MPSFDSGVSHYIRGRAIVEVYFPVDERGNAGMSCSHCYYYSESSKRCLLNNEKPEYPGKYVGSMCPMRNDEDFENELKNTINQKEKGNAEV